MPPTDVEEPLDLRHYLDVLLRRKWLIVGCVVIVTAVAVALSVRETPMYRSSTELLLQSNEAEQRLAGSGQAGTDRNRVQTEIGVVESDLVRRAVAEELGYLPEVDVSAQGETDIIEISATSPEPETAAEVANTYARVYVEWRRQRTIDDLLAAQETVQAEISALQDQLAALQQPVQDLENQLLAAETEAERERIRDEIAELQASTQAERSSLENTLALYRSEISSLQVSQRVTRTGGVQIISDANVPTDPYAPKPLQSGFLGGAVGLMLGVGFAFLRETLDDRVRTREELERVTGWTTIGLVPVIPRPKDRDSDLATLDAPTSAAAEAYRSLRTAVQFIGLDAPLDMVLVTSAKPAEGKTTTAANLAVTLAQAGKRVILLDADLRKPRLHKEFGLPNSAGFTTMLLDSRLGSDTFHRTKVPNLVVVPSGPPPPNPSELLSLGVTRKVITLLCEECDVLLVDSPPVLPVTDALILSGYADGVIVVANAKGAEAKSLRRTRELLDQVNAKVMGVSVNQIDTNAGYGYGYGYEYGYGDRRPPEGPERADEDLEAGDDRPRRLGLFSR